MITSSFFIQNTRSLTLRENPVIWRGHGSRSRPRAALPCSDPQSQGMETQAASVRVKEFSRCGPAPTRTESPACPSGCWCGPPCPAPGVWRAWMRAASRAGKPPGCVCWPCRLRRPPPPWGAGRESRRRRGVPKSSRSGRKGSASPPQGTAALGQAQVIAAERRNNNETDKKMINGTE